MRALDRVGRRTVAVSAVVVLAASVTTSVLGVGQQPGMPFSYPSGTHPVALAAGAGVVYAGYGPDFDAHTDSYSGSSGVLSLPDSQGTAGHQATLAASGFSGYALAADASGDLYYDTVQGGVAELPRGASSPHQLPLDTREYDEASALAVDGAGDVFVVCGSGTLIEIPAGATSVRQDVPIATGGTSPGNYSFVRWVAVDARGDLFLLTDGTALGLIGGYQVLELPAMRGGGWGSAVVLPFTGLAYPAGLAVDAAGDVFVADPYIEEIAELPADAGGGYGSQVMVAPGVGTPVGIAADAAGDVFVAGDGEVVRLPRSTTPAPMRTSTVLTSVTPARTGRPVTVRVSVTAARGSAAPTGRVLVSDGNAGWEWCGAILMAGSGATSTGSCQLTEKSGGDYSFTAEYQGAPGFATSVSAGTVVAVAARPKFQLAKPLLTALAGAPYGYDFVASGIPKRSYVLGPDAPYWLSVDPATGVVSGTVPPGTASFTYSVTASSKAGRVTAGPFTVQVDQGDATFANLAARLSCPAAAVVGTVVTCSLTVTNRGQGAERDVTAAVTVPGQLGGMTQPLDGLVGGNQFAVAGNGEVTMRLGRLAAGASVTEQLMLTVSALNEAALATLRGIVNSAALDQDLATTVSAARITIAALRSRCNPDAQMRVL